MSVRGIRVRYIALALSLIAIIAGIFITFVQSSGFKSTTAVITSVKELPKDFEEDETPHEVYVKYTVDRAKDAGFDNISLDVMLAIPEQTSYSLDKTLEFCASLGVQHISSYILKVEEGTPFYTDRDRLNLFNEDEQAAFYEQSVYKMAQLGYKQYEISNFCVTGRESRHNLRYWHDDEYLGLGPSAHSFIDGKRFYYGNSFESFYNNDTVFESDGGDSEEYIMLALRLSEGLVFEDYRARFGHTVSAGLIKAAERLENNGLCTVTDKAIALTVKGFLVSNSVIAYLTENT